MKTLASLQQVFQNYLLNDDVSIQQAVIASDTVSAETRLGIYQFAYRARMLEALSSNYPLLHVYLGDDEFEKLGFAYLQQYPSTFRSIRWFGDQLPTFMQTNVQDKLFLLELAQIEWTMTEIFDAKDAAPASLDVMSQIPPDEWESICLQLHPSMRLLTLEWNVVPFWQALAEEKKPDEPSQGQPVTWIFGAISWQSILCFTRR